MVSTSDFRKGMVLDLEGDLMSIVDFQHVKPGKGGAFVRTKFKNVLTGARKKKPTSPANGSRKRVWRNSSGSTSITTATTTIL